MVEYLDHNTAADVLNVPDSTIEALSNHIFLEKVCGNFKINGRSQDWAFRKEDVERLIGLNIQSFLWGEGGREEYKKNFDEWRARGGKVGFGIDL